MDNHIENNIVQNEVKKEKSVHEKLGDRMKDYEKKNEAILNNTQPFIVRVDGHCFSKFTKGLAPPFDHYFAMAMINMTADLREQWKADLAYTQSDESTFVFFPRFKKGSETEYKESPYRGRINKIATLFAGLASSRFNFHLSGYFKEQDKEKIKDIKIHYEDKVYSMLPEKKFEYPENVIEKILACNAHFDARVFNVPNEIEVVDNLYWRSGMDCIRNSVSRASTFVFNHKDLLFKNTKQKLQMMLEKGYDWEKENPAFRFGVFIKTERVLQEIEYVRDGEKHTTNAVRPRSFFFSIRMALSDNKQSHIELFKASDFNEELKSKVLVPKKVEVNVEEEKN